MNDFSTLGLSPTQFSKFGHTDSTHGSGDDRSPTAKNTCFHQHVGYKSAFVPKFSACIWHKWIIVPKNFAQIWKMGYVRLGLMNLMACFAMLIVKYINMFFNNMAVLFILNEIQPNTENELSLYSIIRFWSCVSNSSERKMKSSKFLTDTAQCDSWSRETGPTRNAWASAHCAVTIVRFQVYETDLICTKKLDLSWRISHQIPPKYVG